MKMPAHILTYLLKGGHLNVEERKKLELWPNETLVYENILEHLIGIIEREEWFPRNLSEDNDGSCIKEGIIIHNRGHNKFICHSIRTSMTDIDKIAEKSEIEFNNARDAAIYYLKWELHLPGRLDSWPVIKSSS